MEDGLVLISCKNLTKARECLNPCCNGRWSRTNKIKNNSIVAAVLILVVMEDGLVPGNAAPQPTQQATS